jgi:protein-disulfide isomerase
MAESPSLTKRTYGIIAATTALTLALALAACGNTNLLTPQSEATGALTSDAAAGRTSADRGEGNPFTDRSSQVLAAREVIANPTLEEVMRPAGSLPEMSLGRADAPVTLIKYASMTCPFCRQFQMEAFPELKRQYIDTGKMRFILREFPIGFQSGLATVALRCVPEAKYFQAYDRLMRQQNTWASQEVRPDPILKAVADLGLSREKFETCRQDQGMIQALNAVKERGRSLGIVGTPNFFINGRLVKSTLTLNDVKAIIDPILAGQNTATAQKT